MWQTWPLVFRIATLVVWAGLLPACYFRLLLGPVGSKHARDTLQPVGFICVYADHSEEHGSLLDNLHVDSNYHGNGIAKQLITLAMTWLKENAKRPSVHLEVLSGNQHAIKVYEKLGAKRIKEGVWHAPCGSLVDEYVYLWPEIPL